MTSKASLNALAPPVFDGINYQVWAVHMEATLMLVICGKLLVIVSSTIFTKIMTLKITNEIWNFLKKEYEGNERVKVPEKFETTISSLENSKDVSSITLVELLNALQAQEQRRLMRQEGSVEGAF
ncbi:hypothetical protein CK203_084003 [Vitis vinifera]|uniref:DUF4219 domain-containing protein n=1 Tax=Vitis vinifera TaxID=29760 RepID=A0A438EUT7_VITVI|nr:hypothetical protein CK203_084003 [Vitis vinifera]